MTSSPRFYTTDEIAKILHLHVKTVRDLILAKRLKAIKIGNEYRISEEHLAQFVRDNETFSDDDRKVK